MLASLLMILVYRSTMQHKMSILIVLCCALLHMSLIGSDIAICHTVSQNALVLFTVSQAVSYLLCPLLDGWLMSTSPDTSLSCSLSSQ